MARIDRILISLSLTTHISYISREEAGLESDHDGLIIELNNKTDYPKKAQWYFNNELLSNPNFIHDFTTAWKKDTATLSWGACKAWIRKFSIDWIAENKNKSMTIAENKKKLQFMKLKASKDTCRNDRRDNTIHILKEKINTLQLQKQKRNMKTTHT